MTDDDLNRMRAIVEAAVEAPWSVTESETDHAPNFIVRDANGMWVAECGNDPDGARFIASARTDWPACLDEIERLRTKIAELVDERYQFASQCAEALREWNTAALEVTRLRTAILELAEQYFISPSDWESHKDIARLLGPDGVSQWQAWREKAGRG